MKPRKLARQRKNNLIEQGIMTNQVAKFLIEFARKRKYTVFGNLHGEIDFKNSGAKTGKKTLVVISSGAVYGIFACPNTEAAKKALLAETKREDSDVKPIDGAYPLYWGRDIHPGSRIMAHSRVRAETTGNAKLEQIHALQKCKVIFAVIYVERYDRFERELHAAYRPLIGTNRGGNISRFTRIQS